MKRVFGLALILGLSVGLNSATYGQTFPTDYFGQGSYEYPGHGYENPGFGGFGFEYTQGPPVSGIVMNQWGQVIGTTNVAARSAVTADQPAVVQPVARQAVRSRFKKAPVQPRYAVTTGSLAWPGGYGAVVNAPTMRDRSYGYGYSLSPYGTTQYFGPWKGQTLGY
jgi:hypothetical protein